MNQNEISPRSERGCRSVLAACGLSKEALLASLFLLFAGMPISCHAQDAAPASAAAESTNGQPRNAFADNLKPGVKRSNARADQLYTPIKKQDDQADIPEIEMFVGESRVFPTPGVARIAVGNGQIMTASALDGKEVIIFANGVGTSSLFVWNDDGRYQRVKVNIVPGDTTRVAREVAAFLTTIPNAKASIVGDKVIVEGDALADADLVKIEQLEKRYPQIVNFTNRLGWEPMVLLDVKVVEFPVDELRDIGLKWSSAGGAVVGGIWSPGRRGNDGPYQVNIQTGQENAVPIVGADGATAPVTSSLNILSAVNMGLSAQLNLLAQNGKATLLSQPQLAARSGSKASFLAGGEFPYSIVTRDGVSILFKQYGVKLGIEPKVDRKGVVRATIDAEVSKIDSSVSTVAGPALLSRQTTTEFNVHSGETMVLSGLIQMDNSTNIDKVPLLGDIPVLGALFRSKRFQNRETELVIFVTPTVVDSKSQGLVDRVQRVHGRMEQNTGRPSPYLSNPLQPGADPAAPNGNTRPAGTDGAAGTPAGTSSHAPREVDGTAAIVPASIAGRPEPVSNNSPLPPGRNPFAAGRAGAEGGSALKVKQDAVPLRAEPKANSAVLMRLGRGAVVQLGAAAPPAYAGDRWRQVTVGEVRGWVNANVVEPAHLQKEIHPDADSELARMDQHGQQLGLGANAQGVNAVPARQLTPDDAGGGIQAAAPERYRVLLPKLALRAAPDINAAVITHLAAGQNVTASGQTRRRQWIAVEAGGERGWVPVQWLQPAAAGE